MGAQLPPLPRAPGEWKVSEGGKRKRSASVTSRQQVPCNVRRLHVGQFYLLHCVHLVNFLERSGLPETHGSRCGLPRGCPRRGAREGGGPAQRGALGPVGRPLPLVGRAARVPPRMWRKNRRRSCLL